MSLVNQMLKDLEQRRSKYTSADALLAGLEPTSSIPLSSRPHRRWLSYLLLFLSLSTTALAFSYFHDRHLKQLVFKAPVITTPLSPSLAAPQLVAHPANPTQTVAAAKPATATATATTTPNSAVLAPATVVVPPAATTRSSAARLATTPVANAAATVVSRTTAQAIAELKPSASAVTLDDASAMKLAQQGLADVTPPPDLLANGMLNGDSNMRKVAKPLSPEQKAANYYQQAQQNLAVGEISNAISQLRQALNIAPSTLAARISLAAILLEQHQLASAYQVIKVGLALQPGEPNLLLLKARILVEQDQIRQAIQVLQAHTPIMAENLDYYATLAALYQRTQQAAKAIILYQQLLAQHPDNGTWWLGLGLCFEQMGKSAAAVAAYQKAVTLDLSPDLQEEVQQRIKELS